MFSLRVVQKHNAFPSKLSLERSQSTCCNSPDSSFKALWLSPDLKSSNPPSFLHRNKKKIQQMSFLYSALSPTSANRGANDFIFSNFCSGFGLVLCQFPQSSPMTGLGGLMFLTQKSSSTGATGQGKKLIIFGEPQTILQDENTPSG